jgi:hypothetical protein
LAFWVIVSLLFAYKYSLWFLTAAALGLAANAFYWTRIKEHFQSGDSNGGIVVSVDPPLLAVSSDLTKFSGYYPVIKIIPYQTNKDIEIGDRVGTVALYTESSGEQDCWEDFDPIPIDCATEDTAAIDRVLKSYPDEQWAAIERGVSELSKPYHPGLYRVEVGDSDWSSA